MRSYNRIKWALSAALCIAAFSSCQDRAVQEEDDTDYYEIEMEVLDGWMAINRPDLVQSRQEEGYYIEFDPDTTTSGDAATQGGYIKYNITSCDLTGNIFNTRDETMAIQQCTYNRYTRYVPMTDYIPSVSDGYEDDDDDEDYDYEAIELVFMSNELVLDGIVTDVEFKAGTKFTIYYPSALSGTVNGSGGFAGQYTHSGYTPVKSVIEVTEVINTPTIREREDIDEFIEANSHLYPTTDWELVNDAGAHYIRINKNFVPSESEYFTYTDEYPYTKLLRDNTYRTDLPLTVSELNLEIYSKWLDLYDVDMSKSEIGMSDACYIKYIARTLDGFIVDTNIEDVQWLIYDAAGASTGYIYYSAEDYESSYISAWFYVIPKLKYGQWAAFLTTSTNAYTSAGVLASESSSEIPPHTPLLFEVYIWPSTDDDDDIDPYDTEIVD